MEDSTKRAIVLICVGTLIVGLWIWRVHGMNPIEYFEIFFKTLFN